MEKKGYTFDFNREEPTIYHKRFNRPVWLCDLGEGYTINDIEEVKRFLKSVTEILTTSLSKILKVQLRRLMKPLKICGCPLKRAEML